jgi:hypothetical protein
MVILMEPFYIWMPIITMLVSPLVGGAYCLFNRLENHFRRKALLPLINDRFEEFTRNVYSLFNIK